MKRRERIYLMWHEDYIPRYRNNPVCYYNDNMCKGKVSRYHDSYFKTYLCESCAKEESSCPDDRVDAQPYYID